MSTTPAPAEADAPPTPRRRGIPLRISLVALCVALIAVGLAVSGIAVTSAMREDLMSRTDQGLADAGRSWARPKPHDPGPLPQPGPRRPPSPYFVATSTGDGTTVSNDFADEPDLTAVPPGTAGPVTVGSADGSGPSWRVIRVSNPFGESVVGIPLGDVDATVSRLIWLQVLVGLGVLVAVGILGYLLVRSSLRPLRTVEETAHAIAAGNLAMRVPDAAPDTEVGSLSASLNTMLGQIGHAFGVTAASEQQARESEDRMRRFVADASHELRTPLTSIKGFAELYRQGGVPDADDAMRRIDDEAGRMSLLVEDLLVLARLDAHRPIDHAPVDMLVLVADAVHAARAADPAREIHVEVGVGEADGPPLVDGDADRLTQVLRNLLSNAVTHTPPDATVTVGLDTDPTATDIGPAGAVILSVTDTGPGLTEAEQAHVFERFYRGDDSRHRNRTGGGGSGLGLSIVAALVDAHGGTVGVDSPPGSGASFWVRLPRLAG